MFFGNHDHTVDPKGRINIPSKFRDVLVGKGDDRVMITNFVIEGVRCLDVYPMDEWMKLVEEIRKRPKFERRMVKFQNYYIGAASECTLDSQGRILIPPLLRKYADLKRDVMLVAALEKFRIWDLDAWKKVHSEAEETFAQDPDFLNDIGI